MSKDKIRPLLKAVADLPEVHTGFVLDIVNQLRNEDSAKVRMVLGQALASMRTGLNSEAGGNLFNPSEYFVTRDGLMWVSSDFTSRILSAHNKPTEKRGLEGVTHVDLRKNMYDHDIIKEYLGGEEEVRKHAFTPDQIADMIDKQKKGERGKKLLGDGYTNIFYVVGKDEVLFAVHVGGDFGDRHWSVNAYELDMDDWSAGGRIFRNKN